ncbi:MAG: hypothetical protein EA418_05880 [Wenzhouxiangellaceae bacterium]|nr:MAG: hypothetical protein EA418_05880 [Wenzhouxiangellaceae bacterium]
MAMATVAVLGSGLILAARLTAAMAVLLYGCLSTRRLLRPPIRFVSLEPDGLGLFDAAGKRANTIPVSSCFVCPWFIGAGRGARMLGLFREQMAFDHFRRLSVHLRRGGLQ